MTCTWYSKNSLGYTSLDKDPSLATTLQTQNNQTIDGNGKPPNDIWIETGLDNLLIDRAYIQLLDRVHL